MKLVSDYEIKNKSSIVLEYKKPQELIVMDKTVYPAQEIVIEISSEDKIEDMKDKIYNVNDVSIQNQTIIFNEEKLEDVKDISEYGIQN